MVFILSTVYRMLPEFIKNRSFFVNMVQRFNNKRVDKEIESHQMLIDLIFANCDIKATGVMRQIQLLSVELLRLFDKICQKHNIQYWLDYGTLLGAIRHGGFIPWDDDVDIGMLRKDYEKFCEVFPEEINNIEGLSDKVIIQRLKQPHTKDDEITPLDTFNDNTHILFFQCAYKKPFAHFDVFPRDYIEDCGITEKRNKKQMKLQVELRKNIKKGIWSFDEGLKIQNEKMHLTDEKTEYLSDAIDGLHNNIENRLYKTEYVFPLKEVQFEDYTFYMPNNADKYLELIYGPEYMHLPRTALDHNTTGFIKGQYDNIKEDIDAGFDAEIKFLKDINENFK